MRTRKIENTQLIDVQTLRIQISTLTKRHTFGEYPTFLRQSIGNEIVLMTIIPNKDKSYLLDCMLEGTQEIQTFLILGDSAPHGTTQYFFICPMTNRRVRTLFLFGQKVQTRYQANFRYLSQVRHNCNMTNEELGNLFTIKNKCYKSASRQSDICKEIAVTYYYYNQPETTPTKFRNYSAIRTECRVRVDNFREALAGYVQFMRTEKNKIVDLRNQVSDEPKHKEKCGRKKSDPNKPLPLTAINKKIDSITNRLKLPGADKERLNAQLAEAEKKKIEAIVALSPLINEFETWLSSELKPQESIPKDKPSIIKVSQKNGL